MRSRKKILICSAMLVFTGLLPGCGGTTDYTDYFAVSSVVPINNDKENMIEVDYEINNLGKRNDLTFYVAINGVTEKYSIGSGERKSDKVVIDIERPNVYVLEYPITYEVRKNGESVWSKEDMIRYDCTDMFVHNANINYGSESAEIQLIDYQSNYFDLSELFSKFDAHVAHNVIIENGLNEFAKIQKDRNSDNGTNMAASGSILRLSTYGANETNDTYHFTDNLNIKIEDAIGAASVNWKDYLHFTNNAKKSTGSVIGMTVTTMTFYVNVENPSDENIYGSIVKFYVNDRPIPDEYMSSASDHCFVRANDSDELYYVTSGPVIRTTGVTNVQRLGVEVMLEDEAGSILYDDTLWLELE